MTELNRRTLLTMGMSVGMSTGLAGMLAACGHRAGGATDSSQAAPSLSVADLQPVSHPRSLTGPATAVLRSRAIAPVALNPRATLPVTITDAQGTKVTVRDTSRILALDIYGTLARTVFELGLGDSVIGRDTSSAFPEIKHLALVTPAGHDLAGEAILKLGPSVILTDTSLGPWDVLLQMRSSGIPVVVLDPKRSIGTAGTLIQQTADALGVSAAGKALATRTTTAITKRTQQIAAIAPKAKADKLRMIFLYARGQAGVYYMFGRGSGTDSLISALGGVDVAGEIGWKGMRPLTDEGLIKANPDLVLMMTKGLESAGGVDGLLSRFPALAATPAGKNRRVVDMNDTDILAFGPVTADVLEALAVSIYHQSKSAA